MPFKALLPDGAILISIGSSLYIEPLTITPLSISAWDNGLNTIVAQMKSATPNKKYLLNLFIYITYFF